MLRLDGICKRFGEFSMSDVSLEISAGEYFVLLGPSGVGKTLLIELIAGLVRCDSGQISWQDKDITHAAPESRGFSVVYQDYALFEHMTVERNIGYGLRVRKVCRKEIKERVGDLAEMLDIVELLKRRPGNLSGGEKQRVAIARALATEPGMLLLDEPLAALDTNMRGRLRGMLRQINRATGVTVLHVTHDPVEAMSVADKVGVMLDSRIVQVGGVDEMFRRPSNVQVSRFLGMSNVLRVDSVSDQECMVCDESIHVSGADSSVEHIWIGAEEIILSQEPFGSSARNQLLCNVVDWESRGQLIAVNVQCGELKLTALITYRSFGDIGIEAGKTVYATFKSSAVHTL